MDATNEPHHAVFVEERNELPEHSHDETSLGCLPQLRWCLRVVDKTEVKCVELQKILKVAVTSWVDDVLHVPPQRRDYRQQ
ncbi:hypothetical protein T03_4803 [Trichinella britovi]|uniref:Uncharacterized protein n=1 Tax=Trichinella britovi TaxID=45882 RepID=A0A0V1C7H7_TRIBR|nr:hypothetical protein T03_4803 [Trichinella britovi]